MEAGNGLSCFGLKRWFLILTYTLLSKLCLAQMLIRGKVLDSLDNPVDSVRVTARGPDSAGVSLVRSIYTTPDGLFSVPIDTSRSRLLGLQKTGYKDRTLVVPEYTGVKTPLVIYITAIPINILDEVKVKSRPLLIERKLDRTVLNIAGGSLENSGSVADLIKYATGVVILDNEIMFNGRQAAGILINGRKLNLTGRDLIIYLNSLKSTDVKSIELMRQPPANFDAEGSGGLINIVLKKQRLTGLEGTASMDFSRGLGMFPDYHPGLTLNFHKNKLSVNVGVAYEYFKSYFDVDSKRWIEQMGAEYRSIAHSIRKVNLASQSAGIFYDIGKNQSVGIDVMHYISSGGTLTGSDMFIHYLQHPFDTRSAGEFTDSFHKNFSDFSGSYIYRFDSAGSRLKILSDFTTSNDFSGFENHSVYNGVADTILGYSNPGRSGIFTIQADYKRIFNVNEELMLGAKLSNVRILNKNRNTFFKNEGWQDDLASVFDYEYAERIFAGFINFKGKAYKTDFQFGIRGEYAHYKGVILNSLHQDGSDHNGYFDIFPTAYFRRSINRSAGNYMLFSYGRRIKRPAYFELNPFEYLSDSYTIRSGNPQLHPQYTSSFEYSLLLHNKYSLALSYATTDNLISQITAYSKDSAEMSSRYQNIGQARDVDLRAVVPISLTHWWASENTVTIGYAKSKGANFNLARPSFNVQIKQDLNLSENSTIQLFGSYRLSDIWANIIYGPRWRMDLSFQQKLLNGKLTAKLGILDLLHTYGRSVSVQHYSGGAMHFRRNFQSREVDLSVVYNFSIGKAFKNRRFEKSNAAEINRL